MVMRRFRVSEWMSLGTNTRCLTNYKSNYLGRDSSWETKMFESLALVSSPVSGYILCGNRISAVAMMCQSAKYDSRIAVRFEMDY